MGKSTEVRIGDTLFIVHPLNAFEALEVFGDLQKELLPALGEMLGGALAGSVNVDTQEATARAIEKLSSRLSGAELVRWSKRLLTRDTVSVEINGNMLPLDEQTKQLAFAEFTDILELLSQVIRINFAGPLSGFLGRFGMDLRQLKAGGLSANSEKIS